jgi:hypothetical protein
MSQLEDMLFEADVKEEMVLRASVKEGDLFSEISTYGTNDLEDYHPARLDSFSDLRY